MIDITCTKVLFKISCNIYYEGSIIQTNIERNNNNMHKQVSE